MTKEMLSFLSDLADVIERHHGGLSYTIYDDGIYASIGEDWESRVCIEWPSNGNASYIREILKRNETYPQTA